jgi:hypothetical protein
MLSCCSFNTLNAAPENKKDDVTLEIAAALGERGSPILVFTRTNNTDHDLIVYAAGILDSPIFIVKPSGEQVELRANPILTKDMTLKPKQNSRARMDTSDLFLLFDLDEPGSYRIYWTAIPEGNKTVFKSNDILIYRDQKIPATDPKTGHPK